MSVEAIKPVEETPVAKTIPAPEQSETVAPVVADTPATAEQTSATEAAELTPNLATETPVGDDKVAITATPISEGVIGYKEPGFLKQFRYAKTYLWFSEEALAADSLSSYLHSEKSDHAHHQAAWAYETGKGVVFYSKRPEDKATPSGLIVLSDASPIVTDGNTEFSFMVGKQHHRFQATSMNERDGFVVSFEKAIEEAKTIKEDIVGSESYKKRIAFLTPAGQLAATKAERSSSKGPKKSLDASTATAAAAEPTTEVETPAPVVEESKKAKKERSQSRKRASVFGFLGKKDDEKDVKKAEKEIIKEEKKAEKEATKEEKKAEAEEKKEEAKATHEPSKAVEAAEAAAVAAVPAAAVAAAEQKEERKEEETPAEVTTPTEKKNKRTSIFGSLFSKKDVTSPTTEKTEKDATAITTESEVPPVSETAPKLDEPIENKPIDTAAVTAPVDTVETPVATPIVATEEPVKETAAVPTEGASTPKTEKKGGFLGFMKKAELKKDEKKEEAKEEKAAEEIAKDPVVAASTDGATDTAPATVETPAEVKEERAPRENRRSSFFGSFGTLKKKPSEATDGDHTEVKREKSPLPAKIGGLFRKPSKATKLTDAKDEAATETEAAKEDAPVAAATTEAPSTTIVEPTESKIVGDVVPGDFTTGTVHDAVTAAPATQTSA